jgi:hypothetical protein
VPKADRKWWDPTRPQPRCPRRPRSTRPLRKREESTSLVLLAGSRVLSDSDIGRIAGRVHGEVREITCVVQLILVGKACDYHWDIGYFSEDNGS